uniref:Putative adenylate cyclase regulatory protein n=1 Tax=Rhizophora mucronata TaxID=61149 RepID=A0A2P2MLI3_RHIMU
MLIACFCLWFMIRFCNLFSVLYVVDLSNLVSLSFRRNNAITAEGMSSFSGLVNLVKLDLERCPGIGGGLVHLNGIFFILLMKPF